MLVLSRKRGEQIVIPSCALTVTVLAVKGNQVRLGIVAPPEMKVYRDEILRQVGCAEGGAVAEVIQAESELQ